jgi:hypothetical protein
VSTCADCGVPLVDERPAAPEPAPQSDLVGGDPLEYDLTDWDEEARDSLEWMLRGRNVAFQWDAPGVLVVPESEEQVVDGFVDYLAAGPPDAESIEVRDPDPVDMDVDEFYDGDPRRRESEEVEFGSEWTNRDGVRYELSWVQDTGELFMMTEDAGLNVQVLGRFSEERVRALLTGWEQAMTEPHSIEWVREQVDREAGWREPASIPVHEADPGANAEASPAGAVDFSDSWWTPPAAIGWIASQLDDLASSYGEWRAGLQPDAALEAAIADTLDPNTQDRLTSFFEGAMDAVYGEGSGERTRAALRDALEGRALPSP